MSCPICQGATHRLFQQHNYWIVECEACHHRCVEKNPSPEQVKYIYGDHYFRSGGDGYPDYLAEADIITDHGRYYARLLTRYMKPGTVLDVGAAAGFILKGFYEASWRGNGLEPNSMMANYGGTQLDVPIILGVMETFPSNQQYDLISMVQVIAHFYDLRQALQRAAQVTRPGGFWLIESWNKESWTARTFGQYWHEYSPPSVLNWFSPQDLTQLVSQFGYREVARGRPPKWFSAPHAKSLLQYKLETLKWGRLLTGLVGAIPNRLPLPYLGDDLFWALYQDAGD
jgi:SAM-dependent methyltransferase